MKLSKLFIVVCMVITGFALKYFNMTQYFSLAWLHGHAHQLQQMVQNHYWYSALVYCISYISVCIFALPGTTVCMVAGGMLFGVIPGVLLINVSATLGATVLFLISRFVIGSAVQARYHHRLETFNQELTYYGHYYLLVLRIIGVFPFGLLNLLAGLTEISSSTFMWTTSLGIVPLSLLSAYTGHELGHALVLNDMWTFPVVCATAVFLFVRVGLIPVIIQFIRKRRAVYVKPL